MEKNISIAVIGGTGKAGRYLVRHLVSQGYRTRVLARDPDKLDDNHLIEKITGNVADYESVRIVMEGCAAVISTLGQKKGEKPIFSHAATNITRAMSAFNIKRYIVLTGISLDLSSDRKSLRTRIKSIMMRLLFRDTVTDKQREYKILEAGSLEWTIVRVPFIELTDERREVKTSLSDCGGSRIGSAMLAEFLSEQIDSETYIRKAPFIWDD